MIILTDKQISRYMFVSKVLLTGYVVVLVVQTINVIAALAS